MSDRDVTIEPADNGFIVRHYQESGNKNEPGKTIRRVASTREEALKHAGSVLGGGKEKHKKTHHASAEGVIGEHGHSRSARRRRPRTGGRR